jgi:predicted AAA+ superfamily ATPase
MFKNRHLSEHLKAAAGRFPILVVTGPRQSGKTTLLRALFSDYRYVSLEDPDVRKFAQEDPRGFIKTQGHFVIFDEIQRTPDLFSYLQSRVDEPSKAAQYILTGSNNFLMMENVSQSLAGRAGIFHLLPFEQSELIGTSQSLCGVARGQTSISTPGSHSPWDCIWAGFYPRIHTEGMPPQSWLQSYYQTYLERDVRNLLQVGDIDSFSRFVRLVAGRTGQLVDLSGLGADAGVSHTTAKRWLSVLNTSFVTFTLNPYFRNFNKRLIKSPKIYFYDSGLLCFLLGIRNAEQLVVHPMRGQIFESFVVAEFMKHYHHAALIPPLYFWRDSAGHEIDLIVEEGNNLWAYEIKSGQTVASDSFDGLKYWRALSEDNKNTSLIYTGDHAESRSVAEVYSWSQL